MINRLNDAIKMHPSGGGRIAHARRA